MTADRSTEEGWLRRLETAANEHQPGELGRALTFREVLAEAWAHGRERGWDDARDDQFRAENEATKTAKEIARADTADSAP